MSGFAGRDREKVACIMLKGYSMKLVFTRDYGMVIELLQHLMAKSLLKAINMD